MKKNVISFMNMKGGVAKTTLSVNLAYELSKNHNKNILFIDMDPQFNATQYLFYRFKENYMVKDAKQFSTVLDIFKRDEDYHPSSVEKNDSEKNLILQLTNKFSIIPGDLELIKLDASDRGDEQELLNLLEDEKVKENYDYVFIDSAPTYSFYTLATFLACDYYLLPVKPDYFSVLGASLFEKAFADKNRKYRTKNECLGIIFTDIHKGQTINQEIIKKFKRNNKYFLFQEKLFRNADIVKGVEQGTLMSELSTKPKENINKLAIEFLKRMSELND